MSPWTKTAKAPYLSLREEKYRVDHNYLFFLRLWCWQHYRTLRAKLAPCIGSRLTSAAVNFRLPRPFKWAGSATNSWAWEEQAHPTSISLVSNSVGLSFWWLWSDSNGGLYSCFHSLEASWRSTSDSKPSPCMRPSCRLHNTGCLQCLARLVLLQSDGFYYHNASGWVHCHSRW